MSNFADRFNELVDKSEDSGFRSVRNDLYNLLGEVESSRDINNFELRESIQEFIDCRGNYDWIQERNFESQMLGED